jgi:hypothetical protein
MKRLYFSKRQRIVVRLTLPQVTHNLVLAILDKLPCQRCPRGNLLIAGVVTGPEWLPERYSQPGNTPVYPKFVGCGIPFGIYPGRQSKKVRDWTEVRQVVLTQAHVLDRVVEGPSEGP